MKDHVEKTCTRCGDDFPMTSEYFRRDGSSKDGFSRYCKVCAKDMAKDPNKSHYDRTVEIKGVLGWRCPLWSEKCGECRIVNDCWRLLGHIDGDERPTKLRGHLSGTLRKSSRTFEVK